MKLSTSSLILATLLVANTTSAQDIVFSVPTNDIGATLTATSLEIDEGESIGLSLSTKAQGTYGPVVTALQGTYVYSPKQNDWHRGTISYLGGASFRWTNDAGVSWGLTLDPSASRFDTGPDNPYYASYPEARSMPIAYGTNGEVLGFDFFGRYNRLTTPNERIGVDPRGLVSEIYDVDNSWQRVFAAPHSGSYGANYRADNQTETWRPANDWGYALSGGLYYVHIIHYHDLGYGAGAQRFDTWFYVRIKPSAIATNWTKSLGNGEARAQLTLNADLSRTEGYYGTTVRANAGATASVTLLGKYLEVFHMGVSGSIEPGSWSPLNIGARSRIGGYEVMNFDSRYFNRDWEVVLSNPTAGLNGYLKYTGATSNAPKVTISAAAVQSVFKADKTIWVLGWVPVKVSGEAGLYAGLNSSLQANLSQSSLTVSGGTQTKLYGSATAGVDLGFASAGIYGDINLLDAYIDYPLTVAATGQLSGKIDYTLVPVELDFGIYGEVSTFWGSESLRTSLANWKGWREVASIPLF